MNSPGEFQDIESNCSGRLSHVSSQPEMIPSSRALLSRDKRLPLDTWNQSRVQENVSGNQFSTFDSPRDFPQRSSSENVHRNREKQPLEIRRQKQVWQVKTDKIMAQFQCWCLRQDRWLRVLNIQLIPCWPQWLPTGIFYFDLQFRPKLTGTSRKTPEFRKMAKMISLSELILAFFLMRERWQAQKMCEALSSRRSGPNSRFFVSIHNGARLRHLARREVSVQVRARRLREHEVVRGVAGAHPQANSSQRSTAAAAPTAAGAARPHCKLCVCSFKTHLLDLCLSSCADGARQIHMVCAKPQTSREVHQDPEGGLTRQCNARPSFLITCCVWKTPSQVDVTFHNVYDEPELSEREVQVPEDAHQGSEPCLICQDTICSRHDLPRHISRCFFLSHTPCQLLRWSSTWRPLLPSPTQSSLQWPSTWRLHLLSPTQRLLQWPSTWRLHLLSSMPHQRQWLSAVLCRKSVMSMSSTSERD